MKGTLDWFGRASSYQPEMSLTLEGSRLIYQFRALKKAHCRPQAGFVEGLWKYDVAELFLSGPGPTYQEFNISPTGAWWSALFSDYRVREREVPFEPVIQTEMGDSSWRIRFEAEIGHILVWSGLPAQQFRASPTAILYDPEPRYFAWNHAGGGEPDFHRRDLMKRFGETQGD